MSAESGARTGLAFVVAAPSGTGKTTVCQAAVDRDPHLVFSVSHTTRAARAGEREGVDYHFVSRERFDALREAGEFLESAEYAGNLYGTHRAEVEVQLRAGRDVVLELEVQGAAQLRRALPEARQIFLLPPSWEVLEARLRGRRTDDEETIRKRLVIARREMAAAPHFDYAVVNRQVDQAAADFLSIVRAAREGDEASARQRFGAAAVLKGLPGSTDPQQGA